MGINDDEPPPGVTFLEPGLAPDPAGGGEYVASPTLPLPPPRDREELERFLVAVAMTPDGDRSLIRETIAGLGHRDEVAGVLHDALLDLPCRDESRHLILLSVTGELRHDTSLEALERFVWLSDQEVLGPDLGLEQPGSAGSIFHPSGLLQSRAAEMLVWVSFGTYLDGVRLILESHPLDVVRLATIDAYAFAHDDTPGVLDDLRGMVREDDRWAVGLPRRTGQEAADFDAAMARREAEFGAETVVPESLGDTDRPAAGDGRRGSGHVH